MKAPEWTKKEIEVLKRIWASNETVKAQQHLLPGRSIVAIKCAAHVLGLPRKKRGKMSWVRPAVIAKLKEVPGLTAKELSKAIGCCYAQVMLILAELNESDKKRVYVSGWRRAGSLWVQTWTLGSKEDEPKPPRQSREERLLYDRLRHRRQTGNFNPFATLVQQVAA